MSTSKPVSGKHQSILGRRSFLGGVGAGVAGALLLKDVEALAEQVEGPTVRDLLSEGPIRLITNPELSPHNVDQNVANMTAGTTFVGQFLDHDITFDNSSPLGVPAEPTATPNVRDARLDLDSVFSYSTAISNRLSRPKPQVTSR